MKTLLTSLLILSAALSARTFTAVGPQNAYGTGGFTYNSLWHPRRAIPENNGDVLFLATNTSAPDYHALYRFTDTSRSLTVIRPGFLDLPFGNRLTASAWDLVSLGPKGAALLVHCFNGATSTPGVEFIADTTKTGSHSGIPNYNTFLCEPDYLFNSRLVASPNGTALVFDIQTPAQAIRDLYTPNANNRWIATNLTQSLTNYNPNRKFATDADGRFWFACEPAEDGTAVLTVRDTRDADPQPATLFTVRNDSHYAACPLAIAVSHDATTLYFTSYDSEYWNPYSGSQLIAQVLTATFNPVERTISAPVVISRNPLGDPANESCANLTCSADGRFCAFTSTATNLAPQLSADSSQQIYLYDALTDSLTLLSATPNGAPANAACDTPALSPNGRYLTFTTAATNLVNGISRPTLIRTELDFAPVFSPLTVLSGTPQPFTLNANHHSDSALIRLPASLPSGHFLDADGSAVPLNTPIPFSCSLSWTFVPGPDTAFNLTAELSEDNGKNWTTYTIPVTITDSYNEFISYTTDYDVPGKAALGLNTYRSVAVSDDGTKAVFVTNAPLDPDHAFSSCDHAYLHDTLTATTTKLSTDALYSVRSAAITGDGKTVCYVDSDGLLQGLPTTLWPGLAGDTLLTAPAFNHDGSLLAYLAASANTLPSRLVVRTRGGQSRSYDNPGLNESCLLAVNYHGDTVAYTTAGNLLNLLSTADGTVRTLCSLPQSPDALSLSQSGRFVFLKLGKSVYRLPTDTPSESLPAPLCTDATQAAAARNARYLFVISGSALKRLDLETDTWQTIMANCGTAYTKTLTVSAGGDTILFATDLSVIPADTNGTFDLVAVRKAITPTTLPELPDYCLELDELDHSATFELPAPPATDLVILLSDHTSATGRPLALAYPVNNNGHYTLTYQPDPAAAGTDTVTLNAFDGSAWHTLTLTVSLPRDTVSLDLYITATADRPRGPLHKGWNLLSVPVSLDADTLPLFLSALNLSSAWRWDTARAIYTPLTAPVPSHTAFWAWTDKPPVAGSVHLPIITGTRSFQNPTLPGWNLVAPAVCTRHAPDSILFTTDAKATYLFPLLPPHTNDTNPALGYWLYR